MRFLRREKINYFEVILEYSLLGEIVHYSELEKG